MNMSVTASTNPARSISPIAKPVPFRTFYIGRITGYRTFQSKEGKIHLHLMKTKAADEYAHPGTVELSSFSKLGIPGDEIEGFGLLVGYPHSFPVTDKSTGDVTTVHTANMSLRVCD